MRWDEPGDVLQYLGQRASEPCGTSVLTSALAALKVIEQACEVEPDKCFSQAPELANFIKEHAADLGSHASRGITVRKGERYPVMLVVSLEITVVDIALPKYKRAYVWVKLMKYWAALRGDDLQWLSPKDVQLGSRGLECTLIRTKTTGPGKRIEKMFAYVSRQAWYAKEKWLETGWMLWAEFQYDRDYFVPCAARGLGGVRRTMAHYGDLVNYSQALFAESRAPVSGAADPLTWTRIASGGREIHSCWTTPSGAFGRNTRSAAA